MPLTLAADHGSMTGVIFDGFAARSSITRPLFTRTEATVIAARRAPLENTSVRCGKRKPSMDLQSLRRVSNHDGRSGIASDSSHALRKRKG
jgi:hypothetical protein